jgi:hypothetical protein
MVKQKGAILVGAHIIAELLQLRVTDPLGILN